MFGLSKPIVYAVAVLLAGAALGLTVWLGIHEVRSMIDQAATNATAAADAKWSATIEKADAEANKRIADQIAAAMQIQSDAADAANTAAQNYEELRKRNAKLPHGGDICLDAAHVQLLPD